MVSSGQLSHSDSCWLAVRDPSTSVTPNNLSTEWDLPWHENEHGEKGITTPRNTQTGDCWELWRKGKQHREDRAALVPQHSLLGICLALWQPPCSSRGGFRGSCGPLGTAAFFSVFSREVLRSFADCLSCKPSDHGRSWTLPSCLPPCKIGTVILGADTIPQ